MKRILFGLVALALASTASAGNIIMTGHDVLLHGGQRGFDAAALDYIRDGEAKATYDIAVIGTSGSGWGYFTGNGTNVAGLGHGGAIPLAGTLAGYSSAVFWNAESLTGAEFATVDAVVILSHTSCGGCSLTSAGADALEALSGDITTAFNAGLDMYVNSGASDPTYYNFLPPSVATSGTSIGGSTGFTCTADGLALFGATGCASGGSSSMINGFPTHNRFSGFAPDFTVFETRGTEVITIGLKGGTITDDSISVPGPASLLLLAIGLLGAGTLRRRA